MAIEAVKAGLPTYMNTMTLKQQMRNPKKRKGTQEPSKETAANDKDLNKGTGRLDVKA